MFFWGYDKSFWDEANPTGKPSCFKESSPPSRRKCLAFRADLEDCDFGTDWATLLNITGDVPGWQAEQPKRPGSQELPFWGLLKGRPKENQRYPPPKWQTHIFVSGIMFLPQLLITNLKHFACDGIVLLRWGALIESCRGPCTVASRCKRASNAQGSFSKPCAIS